MSERIFKVALVQPMKKAGTSLGIVKAPESIMALAGVLERAEKFGEFTVRMFHAEYGPELMNDLMEFAPDVVGISTMTPNFPDGMRIARALKQSLPGTKIILGGYHASGCVITHLKGQESESLREILNADSPFDFVFAGEGEKVLPELLWEIRSDFPIEAFRNLEGVSYLHKGEMWVNPPAKRITNLGLLSPPSWRGLNVRNFRDLRSGVLDLSVHFHRSCRFTCGFCATPVVLGRGVHVTPSQEAASYIEHLCRQFRPQVITFMDEDFFASTKWAQELVEILLKMDLHHRYGVVFDTFASLNDLCGMGMNNALLHRMYRAGFRSFTTGIESFNPRVLVKYNKEPMIRPLMPRSIRERYDNYSDEMKHSMLTLYHHDATTLAMEVAEAHGFEFIGDYMIGGPDESPEDCAKYFEMFSELSGLFTAYIPVFTPFPGTGVWKEAYDSGKLKRTAEGGIDWAKFDASEGAMNLDYDVAELRNGLEIGFYTSDRYVAEMLAKISRNPESKEGFRQRMNFLREIHHDDPRILAQLKRLGA